MFERFQRGASTTTQVRNDTSPSSGDLVPKNAHALDLDLDNVAGRKLADALRRAGHDHVAWQERHELGHELDDRRHAEHHVGRSRALPQFAVQARLDARVVRIEQGLDPGAERARPVETLRAAPLAVLLLEVAERY